MNRFLFLLSFMISILNSEAQTEFCGLVLDEQKVPIGYANAQVLAMRDSAFVVGGVSGNE